MPHGKVIRYDYTVAIGGHPTGTIDAKAASADGVLPAEETNTGPTAVSDKRQILNGVVVRINVDGAQIPLSLPATRESGGVQNDIDVFTAP